MVLVELSVEGADLSLTESIVQSRVNLIGSNIHARRRGPVDDKILGQPSRLLIGSNVP